MNYLWAIFCIFLKILINFIIVVCNIISWLKYYEWIATIKAVVACWLRSLWRLISIYQNIQNYSKQGRYSQLTSHKIIKLCFKYSATKIIHLITLKISWALQFLNLIRFISSKVRYLLLSTCYRFVCRLS